MNDASAGPTLAGESDLAYASLAEAAQMIAAKKLSPVELVQAHLGRIGRLNPALSAYITVLAERALAQARIAEQDIMRGQSRGPLHGIPFGLKDNYDTQGIRTTAASRLMANNVPATSATLFERLEAGGAILLGKHNTWEFGTGTGELQTDLPVPAARNPWNPEYFAGGSSTGTGVSVGAGLAMFGLGSDTGGSVRIPGATNAIFGHKPTYGRLSRAGILPNSFSLDAPGVLTRTVRDNALVMQAIAGLDPRDPSTADQPVPDYSADIDRGVKGLQIGFVRSFHERDFVGDSEVVAALETALEVFRSLGAKIVELDLGASIMDCRLLTRVIGGTECLAIHEQDFRERNDLMGSALRQKFMGMLGVSGLDYVQATRWRRQIAARVEAAMRTCDAVICAGPVFRIPKAKDETATTPFMISSGACVFNVSGHPAASICTGFDSAGLPLSMQIAANYWDESMLMRTAAAYENATDWHRSRPPCG